MALCDGEGAIQRLTVRVEAVLGDNKKAKLIQCSGALFLFLVFLSFDLLLSTEWNSIRLGGRGHEIMNKTVQKTLPLSGLISELKSNH